jgi:hypothetical protein
MRGAGLIAALGLLAACAGPMGPGTAPMRPVFGPYKDVTLGFDATTAQIGTEVRGRREPAIDLLQPGETLVWAFAFGECGVERFGPHDAEAVVRANVHAFVAARRRYIVSTGGEAGVFTCASENGMERFIARYASEELVGFDFDIEGSQTPEQLDALIGQIARAQRRHPQLHFSFTLATLAASDGSRAGLNATGRAVLQAIRKAGLADFTINLMTMDYGPPQPANCVVTGGVCDMVRSALQAAANLHEVHGVPYDRIALTPMLGINDVPGNTVLPADLREIARVVAAKGLAGLHWWSLDRDAPCASPAQGAADNCSGRAEVPSLGYLRAAREGIEGGR